MTHHATSIPWTRTVLYSSFRSSAAKYCTVVDTVRVQYYTVNVNLSYCTSFSPSRGLFHFHS